MTVIHCYTSASFSYLARARVLAESVRRFHPEWVLWLCLSDREPPGFTFDLAKEEFDHVIRVENLPVADIHTWIFKHDVVEMCTAVKGFMLDLILEAGASKVVYLDPDIAVFAPLDEIERLLDDHVVVLTPHLLDPETELQGVMDNEISALKHGVYNLGFLAVANVPEGRRFASWWRDRLHHYCFDDIPNGLFTDQRWCDLAPALFEGVRILRDPGYNVASWNLSQRPITIEPGGEILAGGETLRFYHFTKITGVGESMIEKYALMSIEPFELVKWYRQRLAAHAADGIAADWWYFKCYDNGESISHSERILYRKNNDLTERFPNPFGVGSGSFFDWLRSESLR